MLFTTKVAAQNRYLICRGCEYFRPWVKTCSTCGCFMPAKVRVASSKCPHDRWLEDTATVDKEYFIDEEL